jgi:hypothetical protein
MSVAAGNLPLSRRFHNQKNLSHCRRNVRNCKKKLPHRYRDAL